jgi:hypothetical protein
MMSLTTSSWTRLQQADDRSSAPIQCDLDSSGESARVSSSRSARGRDGDAISPRERKRAAPVGQQGLRGQKRRVSRHGAAPADWRAGRGVAASPSDTLGVILDMPSANWKLKPADEPGRVRLACYRYPVRRTDQEREDRVNAMLADLPYERPGTFHRAWERLRRAGH